ncbi:MAG: AAC(3) family N-acetyltransferase [Candidatus Omnitrophota bacterium]|jgi:aminoglycoside 3-N-acetyltransferase
MSDITTKNDLLAVFRKLGIERDMDVMVHSSMKSLGFVVNGALDVIDALLETVGRDGTILMPSHTGQLTDPAGWKNPPVPADKIEAVRLSMKPFDPKTTPIRNRGVIPGTFLTYDGIRRSIHPLNSVIARGPRAEYFTAVHELHGSEGMQSPIGRLYENNGHVLLIGVTLARCTAIHLAEFIADVPYLKKNSMKVLVKGKEGKNNFVHLERYPGDSEYFDKVRHDLAGKSIFKEADFRVGRITFFPIKPVVDFVVKRLKEDADYLIKP